MPKLTTKEAREKFDEWNAVRRNLPHMTETEQEVWIHSGKRLREFLGPKRFLDVGWRMNKNGELKLK